MSFATAYVASGMALVSIPKGSKGPRAPGWNRIENVITGPEAARQLLDNIGLAHAYCSPTPTMALDIDDAAQAKEWFAERGIDLDALLSASDSVQIVSGRQGRAKLLYRLPVGVKPIRTIQIEDPATGTMILEFRCATSGGLTVQDVLPPSIHPHTGKAYQWGGNGDWRAPPAIPVEALSIWQKELHNIVARRKSKRLVQSKALDDTPRQRARVAEALVHISADCSYDQYRNVVWAILSLGWTDAEDIACNWSETALHRFDAENFQRVVESYDASRTPTVGTLIHLARVGGWNR